MSVQKRGYGHGGECSWGGGSVPVTVLNFNSIFLSHTFTYFKSEINFTTLLILVFGPIPSCIHDQHDCCYEQRDMSCDHKPIPIETLINFEIFVYTRILDTK